MVFSLFAGECQGLALALPAKIHTFRLRCAPCGTVVPLKVTLGKSAILPRFITLFWVQRHAAARFTSLIRKMRTAHFRGNAWQKYDFAALYRPLFGCSVTLPAMRNNLSLHKGTSTRRG